MADPIIIPAKNTIGELLETLKSDNFPCEIHIAAGATELAINFSKTSDEAIVFNKDGMWSIRKRNGQFKD